MLHKVKFRMDEDGVSVAAAAGVAKDLLYAGSDDRIPKPEPGVFRALHPFLFYVIHKPTSVILFSGRLVRF